VSELECEKISEKMDETNLKNQENNKNSGF
jgi:hypothetical protein